MSDISSIGLLTAFIAGAISFLSPCVLPLVPGYVSYIAGRPVQGGTHGGGVVALRLPAVGLGLCFVLGFSTVFIVLGASATALGQLMLKYRYELNIVRFVSNRDCANVLVAARPSISFEYSRWRTSLGVSAGSFIRIWMDTVHWSHPRCGADNERGFRDRQRRRRAAGGLFARARRSVPARCHLHRHLGRTVEVHEPCGTCPANRGWCTPDCHGGGDDHRIPFGLFLLAPRNVPCARSNRIGAKFAELRRSLRLFAG